LATLIITDGLGELRLRWSGLLGARKVVSEAGWIAEAATASWIRVEVAKKLVEAAGLDLDKLFEQAQSREFNPIELPVHLQARVASQLRPFVSRNVLARYWGGIRY